MKTKKNYRGERQTLSRQALLDAAEQLLAERGTARVSIDDIVDKAGVAKGTFYNHFKDKADIAFEVAAAIRFKVRDQIALAKVVSNDPAMHLAIAHAMFVSLAIRSPARGRILITMLTDVTHPDLLVNERVRYTLERGLAVHRFSFVSLNSALAFALGAVYAGIRSAVEAPAGEVKMVDVAELIALSLKGLGIREAEARQISGEAVKTAFSGK